MVGHKHIHALAHTCPSENCTRQYAIKWWSRAISDILMTIILRETYATVNRLNDIRIFGENRNKSEIDIHVTISHFFDDAYSRAHSPPCAHPCTSIHKYANKIVHLPTTPNIFTRMHIWNTINRAFAKIQLGIMHFNCKYTHTHARTNKISSISNEVWIE